MKVCLVILIFLISVGICCGQQQNTNTQRPINQIEFKQTLFNKGYLFSTKLDSIYTLESGLILRYNGDFNTLNIPITFKRRINKNLSLTTGFQFITITNSNNPELPTNNFETLDFSLYTGGDLNFNESFNGYISIQTRLKKFETDNNKFTPALQTSPINYNLGIKF